MKLQLHGVHIILTEALKERVQQQLLAPLQVLVDNEAAELEVHLSDTNGPKGGLDKECRVTLHVPGRPAVHVTERCEDLHKGIQLAHDRLAEMAKRLQGRRRESSRRRAREAGR